MSIAILYESAETDEMGIRLTAKEMGIDLRYIPFRKVSVAIKDGGYKFRSKGRDYGETVKETKVVLNRTQSKNRRLYAADVLEAFGKYVINPSSVEYLCFSKFRTLLQFWKASIRIPQTVFVPCDAHDQIGETGKTIHNEEEIADLIQAAIGEGPTVIKPDGGTHGQMVKLVKDRGALVKLVDETTPSTLNPVGLFAQEFVQKWFFDLRIVAAKKCGEVPYCYPTALARGGFKDFRTNTYLGNMVFGVAIPPYIRDVAVRCGEAVGQGKEAWVLALDAMLNIPNDRFVDEGYIKAELDKLNKPFKVVQEVKRDKNRILDFASWNSRLEEAYQAYMSTDAYENVKAIIEKSVERSKDSVLFHEANACPEFWEQTRLIAGINVAEPLLVCAESILNNPSCCEVGA